MATPKEVALSKVDTAIQVVSRTQGVLNGLIGFQPHSLPIPRGTLVNFDKVWAHFKVPRFPVSTAGLFPDIKTLDGFLEAINLTYQRMLTNLVQATTLFHDLPKPWFGATTFAFTVADDRSPDDPPKGPDWPNGMYFKSRFGASGSLKQVEVVVHECAHFPKTQLIQDNAQPGSSTYIQMDSSMGLRNAWSYSQFALDCVFNQPMPFHETQ
jgi:hypothetical protein